MIAAYVKLFDLGIAKSVETWLNDELVGGLYGVSMGGVFFGESMFSIEPDASKVALATYVDVLLRKNVALIDCQVYSEHLSSLGGELVNRQRFEKMLSELIPSLDTMQSRYI